MFDCSQMVTILFNILALHVLLFITVCIQNTLVDTQNVSVTKELIPIQFNVLNPNIVLEFHSWLLFS